MRYPRFIGKNLFISNCGFSLKVTCRIITIEKMAKIVNIGQF